MTESTHNERSKAPGFVAMAGVPGWILLALLAVLPGAMATGLSNFEQLKELLLVGGMAVAGVAWGVGALRRGQVRWVPGRAILLGCIFAAYALAASLWANNTLWGVWEALHFVALALALLVVGAPAGRALRFVEVAGALAVGSGVAAVGGLLDFAGVGLFSVVWDPPGPAGTFDAMEFAAAYYVVALPVLLGATLRHKGRLRALFGASFGLSALHFALISTWAWVGIFALALLVSTLLVVGLGGRQARPAIAGALLLAGSVAGLGALAHFALPIDRGETSATSLPRLMNSQHFDEAAAARSGGRAEDLVYSPDRMESVQDWQAHAYLAAVGADLFWARPLVGHGAGGWWSAQTEFANADHPFVAGMFEFYPAFRSPHSALTLILVEYGLVGLVLFGLWIGATFWIGVSALKVREQVDAAQDARGRLTEQWAMLSAGLGGLVFMVFTPLLSLAPAALAWVGVLAWWARAAAGYHGYRGWSAAWEARLAERGARQNAGALKAGAALAMVLGVGALVPTVLQAGAAVHRGRADHLMRATAYAQAIEAYERAFAWFPAAGDVPLNIGLASMRIGRLSDAQQWVERAAQMRPNDVRTMTLEGRFFLRHPDRNRVVRLGTRAVAAYPNSVEARNLLISALDLQARYDEAAAQAIALIERNPPRAEMGKLHKLAADLYADFIQDQVKARQHYAAAMQYLESRELRMQIQQKIDKIDELHDQQRRVREGKPVRPTPTDAHGHEH